MSAVGDPHVTSVTGEKFDLWETGWSPLVQLPKDILARVGATTTCHRKRCSLGSDKCAPALLRVSTPLQISTVVKRPKDLPAR